MADSAYLLPGSSIYSHRSKVALVIWPNRTCWLWQRIGGIGELAAPIDRKDAARWLRERRADFRKPQVRWTQAPTRPRPR